MNKKISIYLLALISHPIQSTNWAQETLNSMTREQKIGQLFIVAAVTNPTDPRNHQLFSNKQWCVDQNYVKHLIKKYGVGGVIFLGTGTIDEQVKATNEFQDASTIPLLIAQDYEAGSGSRDQEGGFRFPCALALGAIKDLTLVYDVAHQIGKQCAALGITINCAPVVDVNTNAGNPVIGTRSFGSDQHNVIAKATAYIEGLQNAGIMACAKHFPGHGDTSIDSHEQLPTINHTRERLHEVELAPFKAVVDEQVKSIMVGHLQVPALDQQNSASLSKKVISDLLRNELSFDGLVITDALHMRAVSDHYRPGDLELEALKAGNDILLCPTDVPRAVAQIDNAIEKGIVSEQELNERVLRILRAKEWLFSQRAWHTHAADNYDQIIHNESSYLLKKTIYEHAITAYNYDEPHINVPDALLIQIGNAPEDRLSKTINTVVKNIIKISQSPTRDEIEQIVSVVNSTQPVVIAVFGMTRDAQHQFGVSQNSLDLIKLLHNKTTTAVAVFGSPYLLKDLHSTTHALIAYEDDPIAQEMLAHILMGTQKAVGTLPIRL